VSHALALASSRFSAVLDPRHGGEIFSLVDLERGRNVLAGPAFSPEDTAKGALGFEDWVRGYRGGWQFIGPNVGAPCALTGEEHAFHGRASTAPWDVESASAREAVLTWQGHGLAFRRTIVVDDEGVHVELEARSLSRPAPLVVAEHLAFGVELLDPEVTVEMNASAVYEWGPDGPVAPPADAPSWPRALLLDGSVHDLDHFPGAGPGRLLTASAVQPGRVRVANPARSLAYEITWEDTSWLSHVWLWREEHGAGGPWRERASLLVVEPASVPHDLGLAQAVERGEARVLGPGQRASYAASLRAVAP
jgi:galactose mutarotase-like enzyme